MIKTILVTGASGYIGSVLVPMLLKKNYKVRALDRFFFGNFLKKNKNLTILKADTRHLKSSYFRKIYAVIDLAALSNDPSGEYFKKETMNINFKARFSCARLAKKNNVKRYVLPSSCSIYGFNESIVNEKSKVNPLTTYAKANLLAERNILPLSNKNFCVTVLRQATIFGYSPRMRYDLAINGMTEEAFRTKKLPIMRDGSQIRPMLHVKDTSRAIIMMLEKDNKIINKQIFNVGSKECTRSINDMAKIVKENIKDAKLKWYGNPDVRSYNVDFSKISSLGFKKLYDLNYGVREIISKLRQSKKNYKKKINITLDWYQSLEQLAPYIFDCQIKKKIIKNF